MIRAFTVVLLMSLSATITKAQTGFINTLMPLPAELHISHGDIILSPQTTFHLQATASPALQAAARRMIVRMQNRTDIQFAHPFTDDGSAATVNIQVNDVTSTLPSLGDDESYRIDIEGGTATIRSGTVFGAYHGFETLLQLVQVESGRFVLPAVHIVDAPRFPWRGLLLDPGRHFLPVAAILRTLDGMAAVKLNVLHLHLTENQGFRLESLRFPKLQESGSEGLFYTQQQMREIVAYAAARGIRVVPEFDMPGHSTSWFAGYPELASAPGPYHPEHGFGIFDAAMDPTRESTYQFLDAFFAEMVKIFPDQYVHIGGDESNGRQWRSNPSIQAFMKAHHMADTKELQAYFNKRVQEILLKYHRTMIGWDEVLHPDLSPDVVIQNWHGIEFLINGAKQGHKGLLSQPYYLDHNYTAGAMFLTDPIPADSPLTPAQTRLILGGEACMWGEQVVDATIDSRIWPRSAAVAERLWSPQSDRDASDMYRRLEVESLRLDSIGIQQISGPQRQLRGIAGAESSPSLETFAAVLQPADFSQRSRRQHNTRDTPMTAMVDAVRPDPPLRQELGRWTNAYLQSTSGAMHDEAHHRLEALFRSWIATGPELDVLAQSRPQVAATSLRRQQLVSLGQLGLDAITAHEKSSKFTADQNAAASEFLKRAATPDDELVDFAVLDSMERLVGAVRPSH
jgi:hexosaminidase